jgi:hypothetical protein
MRRFAYVVMGLVIAVPCAGQRESAPPSVAASVLELEDGFVDANGMLIYYKALGRGDPLVVVHGGPGSSHDYFLPYLIPLARTNRLVFIDERGGRPPRPTP